MPGTAPDVTQVSAGIDELLVRYRELRGQVESLTVVDDAGQNSAGNHARIEQTGIGFVGSLPPGDHPALLAIPGPAPGPLPPTGTPVLPAWTPP